MSEFSLSPDARQCLWRCYSLLLKLADQAEQDTAGSELDKDQESVAETAINSLPQLLDDDSQEVGSEQLMTTEQSE